MDDDWGYPLPRDMSVGHLDKHRFVPLGVFRAPENPRVYHHVPERIKKDKIFRFPEMGVALNHS